MMCSPDVSCDLWIIREWVNRRCRETATVEQRQRMIDEVRNDENAGYELPDDYTSGSRLHVFASDDCETWIGCLDGMLIDPEKLLHLIPLMVSCLSPTFGELSFPAAVALDGSVVVALDGRRVTDCYRLGVHHEPAQ